MGDPFRLLLHICCAPDAAHGIPAMGQRFLVTGFFYNPNIGAADEFAKRLEAVRRLREARPFALDVAYGGEAAWEEATRGFADAPERGARCEACIRMRLRRTAEEAFARGMEAFGTVLTVSPKKDAAMVNRIGREEGERAGIPFVEADLKKKDGFRKSVEASRRIGLYRQDFCGCRHSVRRK